MQENNKTIVDKQKGSGRETAASPPTAMETSWLSKAVSKYTGPVLVQIGVVLIWQLTADFGGLPSYILPSPIDTLATLADSSNAWFDNSVTTAIEIIGGFILAVITGVSISLFFSWSKILYGLFMPLLVALNMVPKVALGPIIIVWFSYGILTNTLIAFSICFFPIVITTARGLREIEPELLYLSRTLKASKWQVFTKIQFPGSLPYLFSGMKVSAVLAVAGAIVGEFIGSERGLGYLMLQVQINLDTAAMFMAVLLISFIGMALYGAVALLEFILVRRGGQA